MSPYADDYGGAILNATISLFASASIKPRQDDLVILNSRDLGEKSELKLSKQLPYNGTLDLFKGVFNRLVRDFDVKPQGFELTTEVDAPKGSGLGTSSAVTVAVLGAFAEWFKLPLGEYDFARLAYDIERIDLAMSGGRQDQYAATFGGFNYMEFYEGEKVIVNPLRVRTSMRKELEHNLLLFYTGTSRLSAKIIDKQQEAFAKKKSGNASIEAAHALKKQAQKMKDALLTGKLDEIGFWLDYGWQHKKGLAKGISSPEIDDLYDAALAAGATGGKISGAGGGGFMTFYCPGNTRHEVMSALKNRGGQLRPFVFVNEGMVSWEAKLD